MSSFGLDDTSASSPLTESRVQAVLRWFDKRMNVWKKSTPNDMLTGMARSIENPSKNEGWTDIFVYSADDPRVPICCSRHV